MNPSIKNKDLGSNVASVSKAVVHDVNENGLDICVAHKTIIEYFDHKTKGTRVAKRSDLNPFEITPYLPFVTLFDLTFDDDDEMVDMTVRLLGTGMVSFYGEWTGKSVLNDHSETGLMNVYPETYKRLILLVETAIKRKKPFIISSSQLSKDRTHLKSDSLAIPLSNDGESINMILMHTNLTTTKLA